VFSVTYLSTMAKKVPLASRYSPPSEKDTVSHPVKAWNTRSARVFPGPRKLAMSWVAMSLTFFPHSNAIHSSVAVIF
jgi:hypothetical protein